MVPFPEGAFFTKLAFGEGDGEPRIFTVASGPQNDCGRFKDRTPLGDRSVSVPLAVADLDGDGDVDVAGSLLDTLVISLQTAPRRFKTFLETLRSPGILGLVAADLDMDGDADLAAAILKEVDGGVGAFLNRGDATFDAPLFFSEKGLVHILTTSGDLDGDGAPDLVASTYAPCLDMGCEFETRIMVLRNDTRFATSADANANGRPDECDPGAFHRGDADGDGTLSLTDAIFTLRALFQGGPAAGCAEAADADNDGSVSLTDPISVLEFLFRGGAPPAAPGPPPRPCGLDTNAAGSPGALGCETYASC